MVQKSNSKSICTMKVVLLELYARIIFDLLTLNKLFIQSNLWL